MSKRTDLSITRDALESSDLLKFVMACEDMQVEQDIAKAIKEIVNDGKPSERLQAAELFLKYKYGNPKQQTDVTSGGEKLTSVGFDIFKNDSNK